MKEKNYSSIHPTIKLESGGEIIILNNQAVINAEAEAMLQALHSRSTGGFREHLEKLNEKGPEDFMKNFYLGYGHKSIGDCGSTTIFVEGISMLAAKAIQDNQLYSGQESSTRYIDFSKQNFIDPIGNNKSKNLFEKQREFYIKSQEPTKEYLKKIYSKNENENESLYNKAINARAFDITRCLLPAGTSTNLSWHTNLRQASDKILFLRHHPLKELKEIGDKLEDILQTHHPNSFDKKRYNLSEDYQDIIANNYFFHNLNSPKNPEIIFNIDFKELEKYNELFKKRPKKTELPKYLSQIGTITAEFQLDFGSFRDIQRHRAINQRMPLLTTDLGFNQWYLNNLPVKIKEQMPEYLNSISKEIKEFNLSPEQEQYFLPMGYNTSNKFTGDLPAVIYLIELRDSRFVHPTLQKIVHNLGLQITNKLNIKINSDPEPSRFDIKRGEQDIITL